MTGFHCPVRITFGEGAATGAPEHLLPHTGPGGRVLVLVDPGCAGLGLHAPIARALADAGFEVRVHADGRPNPTLEDVAAAAHAFRQFGATALLALGGGSTLDLAKGVVVADRLGPDLRRYDRHGATIPGPLAPLVAVPTTAGSGSEVTPFAVFVDPRAGDKVVLSAPALFPVAALLDPALLRTLPREPLIAAAVDAVTHAIESFLGRRGSPAVDALALEALHLLWGPLPEAVEHWPETGHAGALLWGSTLAGIAVANGSAGIVHAISNLLSARYGASHGLANAAVLAPVLRFLAPATAERLARLAPAIGADSAAVVPGTVAAALERLRPGGGLGALGVPRADLPSLAAVLARDHQTHFNTPRAPDARALLRILEEGY